MIHRIAVDKMILFRESRREKGKADAD